MRQRHAVDVRQSSAQLRQSRERALHIAALAREIGAHQLVRKRVGLYAAPACLVLEQVIGRLWQMDRSGGHGADCRPVLRAGMRRAGSGDRSVLRDGSGGCVQLLVCDMGVAADG